MALKRRNFLLFLGASVGTVAAGCFPVVGKHYSMPFTNKSSDANAVGSSLSFQPVRGLIPLATDGLELTKGASKNNFAIFSPSASAQVPPELAEGGTASFIVWIKHNIAHAVPLQTMDLLRGCLLSK